MNAHSVQEEQNSTDTLSVTQGTRRFTLVDSVHPHRTSRLAPAEQGLFTQKHVLFARTGLGILYITATTLSES
jgi:hypothetical protein